MDVALPRPGRRWHLLVLDVEIRPGPLEVPEGTMRDQFLALKAAQASSMVMGLVLEQTQVAHSPPINAHVALRSIPCQSLKSRMKSNRPTFEWCDENSRICDVDRYLVFENMPLEFRNL
jgi:hypothetical protein